MSGPIVMSANENTFLLFDCIGKTNVKYLKMLFWFVTKKVDSCLVFYKLDSADSVSTVANNKTIKIKLDIYFPKGGFCANGAIALAKYLTDVYGNEFKYEICINNLLISLDKIINTYTVTCPTPLEINKFVITPKKQNIHDNRYVFFSLTIAGENHLITFQPISDDSLVKIGMLHCDTYIANFSKCIVENNSVYVKTFERGIKRFTASCGTAVMCAAYAIHENELISRIDRVYNVVNDMFKYIVNTDGGKSLVLLSQSKHTICLQVSNVMYD